MICVGVRFHANIINSWNSFLNITFIFLSRRITFVKLLMSGGGGHLVSFDKNSLYFGQLVHYQEHDNINLKKTQTK